MKSFKILLAVVALVSFQCVVFSAGVVTSADETSLRNALAGGGTVTFDCDGVIVLSNRLMDSISIVTDTILDASGHKVTISGNDATQIFFVATNVNFVIKNLTLANGAIISEELGGGEGGGALYNDGLVQVIQCIFYNNIASGANVEPNHYLGASAGLGGAIFNMGILFVGDSIFINNRAAGTNTNQGIGSAGSGGAIYNYGMLSVSNSLFIGNSAIGGYGTPNLGPHYGGDSYGGAIYNNNSASIFNCTFSSNSASGGRGGNGTSGFSNIIDGDSGGDASGGGICNYALLSVLNTTFEENAVLGGAGGNGYSNWPPNGGNAGDGGGANGGGTSSSGGNAIIVNSTFFKNSVVGGVGGQGGKGYNSPPGNGPSGNGGNGGNGADGIAGGISLLAGTINVTNITCAGNTSLGGMFGSGGAGGAPALQVAAGSPGLNGTSGGSYGENVASIYGSLLLKNTIVSGASFGMNAYGPIIDGGYNLSSDASCNFANIGSANNVNPLLGPIANNGGPTETCALLSGSPAIDAITDGSYPVTDQRGFNRPFGSAGDIGAVEYYPGAFIIHSLALKNNQWQIAGTGFPSTAYSLQASTNLKSWFTVATNATSSDGSFKSLNTATDSASQFYRISIP